MMIISFELCCIALLLPSCLAIKCNFRYSEDDKNYPQQIIDALLGRSFAIETSRTDFNVSNNGDPTEFNCDDDPDETGISLVDFVKNRFDESTASRDTSIDDDADSESLCCTTLKTIRPKTLPSVLNNKLVTVVNHGEFSQTVTIEECSDANKPCQFDQNFPLGYATKCKQKHQMHVIKALNSEKNAIVDETIYYPSGCECKVYPKKSPKI